MWMCGSLVGTCYWKLICAYSCSYSTLLAVLFQYRLQVIWLNVRVSSDIKVTSFAVSSLFLSHSVTAVFCSVYSCVNSKAEWPEISRWWCVFLPRSTHIPLAVLSPLDGWDWMSSLYLIWKSVNSSWFGNFSLPLDFILLGISTEAA